MQNHRNIAKEVEMLYPAEMAQPTSCVRQTSMGKQDCVERSVVHYASETTQPTKPKPQSKVKCNRSIYIIYMLKSRYGSPPFGAQYPIGLELGNWSSALQWLSLFRLI
jgi:hypothetical protein